MKQITIKANGCHDCMLANYTNTSDWWGYKCIASLNKMDVSMCVGNKIFHPRCPMENIKEITDKTKEEG